MEEPAEEQSQQGCYPPFRIDVSHLWQIDNVFELAKQSVNVRFDMERCYGDKDSQILLGGRP